MSRKKGLFNVKVDPEFEKLIDPLSDEEYNQLKENIREYGLQDKILVWREPGADIDLIVDGHNRFRVLTELSQESDEFKIDDNCFTSGGFLFRTRDEVKEYMIKNQLGRRNLTREQKLRYIGQLQKSRKKTHGGDRKSEESKGQNEPLMKSTAAQIAEEVGVSESTVKRAEKFSRGIDALETVSKEAAEKVLMGKSGVSAVDVSNFPKMKPDEQDNFIELVINPEKKKKIAKEPETYVDGEYSDVVSNAVPEDTVFVSVPISKALFKTIKDVAALTGESPDELINRHVMNNLHTDIECLGAGIYKCCGDIDKINALINSIKKTTGLKVDNFMLKDFNEGKAITDYQRKCLYIGGYLKDHIVPKASLEQ